MTEFPWGSLEPVSRSALRLFGEIRHQFGELPALEQVERALGELVGSRVQIKLRALRADNPAPAGPNALDLLLDGHVPARFDLEPAFIADVVGRTLGQVHGVDNISSELDASLLGAVGAIVAEASRRCGISASRHRSSPQPGGLALGLDVTLRLDGSTYSAQIWVSRADNIGIRNSAEPSLDACSDLLVAMPLVVGAALATPTELEQLGVGDAWLSGPGFWLDDKGAGRALVIAPDGEQGVWVDLAPDGRAVLRSDVGRLSIDPEPESTRGAADMPKSDDKLSSTLTSAVLDSPVVVRVEVGTISLTVRDWSALRPGDVLELGHRVGEPVVLRIAGREVARGDLVNVEGEIGVRIRELSPKADQ